jgi:hypothetical protein
VTPPIAAHRNQLSPLVATMISPFGNATVLPDAAWHSEPAHRGTFSILSSCLITMALCIWTAVHLNLPEHEKESQQFYKKIVWLLLGLFAPEVVVWNAWRQRKSMKQLSGNMRRMGYMAVETKVWKSVQDWLERASDGIKVFFLLRAEDLPKPLGPRKGNDLRQDRIHPWTDVHSWYIVMGGLAFEDTAAEELQFMPGNRSRLTLTYHAVVWMAKNRASLLPDISRQHIEDKSKAGGLGKFLTCWQATYFCAQCVFRLSRRYSISLLELNVFAHALCALILLWIWWDKPQGVQEPTLITDQDGMDICAYFSLKPQGVWYPQKDGFKDDSSPGGPDTRWVPCHPCSDAWEVFAPTHVTLHRQHDSQSHPVTPNIVTMHDQFGDHVCSLLFGPYRQPCLKVSETFWTIETRKRTWRKWTTCELNSRCIQRLLRAYGRVEKDEAFRSTGVVDQCSDFDWRGLRSLAHVMDDAYWVIRNIGVTHSQFERRAIRPAVGLTLAGFCYGGLHLTAWTCRFPSHAETLLWHAASVTIMATGPTVIAYALGKGVAAFINHSERIRLQSRTRKLGRLAFLALDLLESCIKSLAKPIFWLWTTWYIFCRAYIVVECFIMLAHLPDTTLEIPSWARYIPHIT